MGMRFFGRDLFWCWRHLRYLPFYAWYFLRCFALVKHPLRFIRCYMTLQLPEERLVEFRNGMKIHLSSHPHDLVTVFVIFVRRDYGRVTPAQTVVDIGANIGVFALYAASEGAARVEAYEPNSEAFALLRRNIEVNGLQGAIIPRQLAVTAQAGQQVSFPKRASAYNAIVRQGAPTTEECETVQTTSLEELAQPLSSVDLLKVDCEGAEYEILLGCRPQTLAKVRQLRLEYHNGRVQELTAHLARSGLKQILLRPDSDLSGNAWFGR